MRTSKEASPSGVMNWPLYLLMTFAQFFREVALEDALHHLVKERRLDQISGAVLETTDIVAQTGAQVNSREHRQYQLGRLIDKLVKHWMDCVKAIMVQE